MIIYLLHTNLLGYRLILNVCTEESKAVGKFVCVDVLWPCQPKGVMSSAVRLLDHTFTGKALSSMRLTSIVHIPLTETDKCPS